MGVSVRPQDFNDLADLTMFAAIVEHGGVSAASRQLAIPKSRLSRHLAGLEDRYGVQLLHRSTRKFAVTELGQALYQQCQSLLDGTQAARSLMANSQAAPHGSLRVSAPSPLANFWLAPLLPRFLGAYPTIRLELEGSERVVDLLADRIDLAIHVRPLASQDGDLVVRQLGMSRHVLVAAPAFLAKHGEPVRPEDLSRYPLLGIRTPQGRTEWELAGQDGTVHTIREELRLATLELGVLRRAAAEGLGIALLPAHFCKTACESGDLVRVLPEWRGPVNDIHAVFPSRRGLSRTARAFLDFLVAELPSGDA